MNQTKRLAALGAVAVALATAGVSQATGQESPAATKPDTSRAETCLAATRSELADTRYSVTSIRLEHRIDGREIYSLSGADTNCILVAGAEQEAGRSESLACVDPAVAKVALPMQTGFDLKSGNGYVDLVWTEAPSEIAASGDVADVQVGVSVTAVTRSSDSRGGQLTWKTPGGTVVEVALLSRADRDARIKAMSGLQSG